MNKIIIKAYKYYKQQYFKQLKYYKKYNISFEDHLHEPLVNGFCWRDTKEGGMYWNHIYMSIDNNTFCDQLIQYHYKSLHFIKLDF